MNLQIRNRRIKQQYKLGMKVKSLATKNFLSEERVRQIIREKDVNDFYKELEQTYKTIISEADYKWLKDEIKLLAKENRNKEFVIRRRILVRYLHDKLNYPFYRIGQILKRHHTSIMNAYYNHD